MYSLNRYKGNYNEIFTSGLPVIFNDKHITYLETQFAQTGNVADLLRGPYRRIISNCQNDVIQRTQRAHVSCQNQLLQK